MIRASANPLLPGYFADPSILQEAGSIYIYATLDPWGGESLGCWESTDWKHWSYRELNWPTKAACTSPTSQAAMVWAPSVVKGADGNFHMAVSIGSEVWAGVANHPLGPWRNALGEEKPLIPADYKPGYHMIDAEYFLDDDGQAWLYWGSGWNWINGKCWAVKLKSDLTTFDSEVHDISPENYFEAPLMVKEEGRYYLMYSSGKTTEDTYQVHYAVGKTPLGPFTEAPNSPILISDAENQILGPGHHTVFRRKGETYILYHRHSIPFDPKFMGRQICADRLIFNDGLIENVVPTHSGPEFAQRNLAALPAVAYASNHASPAFSAANILDNNYATRWAASPDSVGAWIQLDLGFVRTISRQEIRPEYPWKPCRFSVEAWVDGYAWSLVANCTGTMGSPIVIAKETTARYLRLVFPPEVKGSEISLFEWAVF